MSLRVEAVRLRSRAPDVAAQFWAGLLRRAPRSEAGTWFLPGVRAEVGLRFVATDVGAQAFWVPHFHLHLASESLAHQRHLVSQAVALGARHVDVGQRPEEKHIVLADRDGLEFCVIEPDNTYLRGCGLLAEVTCDGTREEGLFWRNALTWPLVWDEGAQTVVQSPAGGTKIAWDVPTAPPLDPGGYWLDLVADDPIGEAGRLTVLGAAPVGRAAKAGSLGDEVRMFDPDGRVFAIQSSRLD